MPYDDIHPASVSRDGAIGYAQENCRPRMVPLVLLLVVVLMVGDLE